jgi:hypothetical protein
MVKVITKKDFFSGKKALFPTPPSLQQILKMSSAEQPILMLTASGADPSQDIRELAQSTVGMDKYIEVIKLILVSKALLDSTLYCLRQA